ncbi:putative Zn(II)2Cys6 transcription factor-like protein [Polyplosphaeria fusca]|uniref:Zn(II)2Cys6 transcription factor-like protein n=1 Tax=Polyplosphaeria fusca TaxID=682080 RepID=A0A9P4QKL9_9PLEO|nr:putative Zn(II)2Cys6 transcription factor-like protein [Polyplosphaeria fusca]
MGEQRPRQRKFAPRSRQGCLTCRARRKRCDGQRPLCANCDRLNVKCQWQSQRSVVPDASDSAAPPSNALGPLRASPDPWELFTVGGVAETEHLLSYYVKAYVPSVSVATTASSFYTSLYIPMAAQSKGVFDAIMALSSAQLARRTANTDRAQHLFALSSKHQAKCHSFIGDRISTTSQPLNDAYQVISVILLLIGLEALNGAKDIKWISQTECVRRMLNTLYREQGHTESWELECIRRHFTYHDVMLAVMAGVTGHRAKTPSQRDAPQLRNPVPSLTIDPLMGLSSYLCSWITHIQYVTSPNPAFPHISEAAFHAIEREIKDWTYESPMSYPDMDIAVALDLVALAESFRMAGLIHLYRKSESHKALVPRCASRAMEFVARIPPGSPADSSLLYPIFLAGAELNSKAEISRCSERLTAIQARNRYENVGNVHKILQEVWKSVLNGEPKRDWEDILRERGWSISLS